MRPTQHPVVRVSLAIVVALAASACSETSSPGGTTGSNTHNLPIVMGNFHINTAPVITNQDGQSANIVDDYVTPAQLPSVSFEVFTTHLYAPVSADVSTHLSNIRVRVLRTDGIRTGNIFQGVEFAGAITHQGQRYDVYRLNGLYVSQPAITKTNFANVTFETDLTYKNSQGTTLTQRAVTLSVYKRN